MKGNTKLFNLKPTESVVFFLVVYNDDWVNPKKHTVQSYTSVPTSVKHGPDSTASSERDISNQK